MKRLFVALSSETWEALVHASAREMRHPSRQAAYILREALLGVSQVAHHPEEPAASARRNQGRGDLAR
ncbi:MAG: hypothetical protein ACP5VP_04400 [Candidatus Limnocylindrales bacterium]